MRNKDIKRLLLKENGVTLTEMLLAVALLAIIAIPLLNMVLASVQSNAASKQRTQAQAFAEQVMEETKAQKIISSTDGLTEYSTSADGRLTAWRQIDRIEEGDVSPSTDYSYDPREADDPDFELVIDQKDDGGINSIAFKDSEASTSDIILDNEDISAANSVFRLTLNKNGQEYLYGFGEDTAAASVFLPKDHDDAKTIKLRVVYQGEISAVISGFLNIFTAVNLDQDDEFIIYVINKEKNESGVNFINRGNSDFQVNYMSTQVFDANEPLNQLFKVTVVIKNSEKEIYRTSSYIKK